MSEIEAVDGDTKRVHIQRPERYWMATAELFPAMTDPDVLDYTDDVDSMGESFAATIRDNTRARPLVSLPGEPRR